MIEKIGRDAFLYFDPAKVPKDDFAQCGTCRMWVPDQVSGIGKDLCILHGSKVEVDGGDSCGLYAPWPKGKPVRPVIADHADELRPGLPGSVTPEQSGLVSREVRCENCEFFDGAESECQLYDTLNKTFPKLFKLDTKTNRYGCCNANTAKDDDGDEGSEDADELQAMVSTAKRRLGK